MAVLSGYMQDAQGRLVPLAAIQAEHKLEDELVHLVKRNLGHESLAATSHYLYSRAGDSSSNYLSIGAANAQAGG